MLDAEGMNLCSRQHLDLYRTHAYYDQNSYLSVQNLTAIKARIDVNMNNFEEKNSKNMSLKFNTICFVDYLEWFKYLRILHV
jgi:hypothetical protein